MPELPEVEYARRSLARWLRGATIEEVVIGDARILDESAAKTKRALIGHRVTAVHRRGKWLRISLDRGRLFSHLGMTGKWIETMVDAPTPRFERFRLEVTQKKKTRSLRYLDPRLFGRITTEDLPAWNQLGPDPIHDGLDVDVLYAQLQQRGSPIKPALMDQSLIAGLGNIQVTEALYFARIAPDRPSRSLTRAEVKKLIRAIDRSLWRTLKIESGPSITYVEETGAENPFTIYGRGGEPCPSCEKPLSRTTLGGRGTVFCSRCQN